MDEFDKAIAQIEIDNSSEINGALKDYFTVLEKENGTFNLKWEKNISTHIRHKVSKLVKKYYIPKTV
jgi:16S rRNA G527 N7-methylase RsmG